MPVSGNDKASRKHRINYSNSFRNQQGEHFAESFSREDELRHSTGSMKGHYAISGRFRNERSSKHPAGTPGEERNMNGKRSGSNESQTSDKEEKTPSHSVSYLIRGFESKGESTPEGTPQLTLNDEQYTYTDGDPSLSTNNEKNKRNGSKRKLSIRKRAKAHHDANVTVLQKLGIAPFMGSENRNPKKALSYFDVQSILFDIDNATVLKALYEEGGNRPRNISTGASAASMRAQGKKKPGDENGKALTRTDSIIDEGDGLSNELVESCPYFRNETGTESKENHVNSMHKLLGKYRGDVSSRIWTSFGKHRTPSLELLPTTDADSDAFFGSAVKLNEIDQKREVTILEPIGANSKITLWDNAKNSKEKRIFDFEHIDDGALYYREYFFGKGKENYFTN